MGNKPRPRKIYPKLPDEYLERIDRAWNAIEEGDPYLAALDAEEMMEETDAHPEVRLLYGVALLENEEHVEALEHLIGCEGQVEDAGLHKFYLARALHENLRTADAIRLLREVIAEDPEAAENHYFLAEALEFLGRWEDAERQYEEAFRLEPMDFPLPTRMTPAAFEEVVRESIDILPEELREKMEDVAVVVEPLPAREALVSHSAEVSLSPGICGLFIGPSYQDRGSLGPTTIPPTIFIYQRNLERYCQMREQLIHQIEMTIFHELGHYLGLSEEELEERGLE
jgi:predicted Zn-dependent protease with MMP-like domain